MNTIKIAFVLPQNVACAIANANDAYAVDLIVNFFFRCVGSESMYVRQTNGMPQYYIEGATLYVMAEDAEESHDPRARLLEARPTFVDDYIVIDDEFLRALGFKESVSQLVEYADVFGEQQRFREQERLRAYPLG